MSGRDAAADRRRVIRVLPDDLANKIAAGEVVERPASIVKELCENAIDACASRVDVEVEGGGVARISVIDDGVGMPAEELPLALIRHATSKISSADDLARIGSFGFRGEALPSIAAVSRFEMCSRPREHAEGRLVRGDAPGALEPCGMAVGTRVTVRDLFHNVPARLKFLRSLATEAAHVTEVIEGLALANPEVTITLTRDGRRVKEYLRATTREARVRQVLAATELIACAGELGPLRLEAFLSPPERARMGATGLWLFVNRRPIDDRAIARAVAHAYGSLLEPGRYPVGAVFLELPLELVDVNVHPQKSEVRFADGRAVQGATHRLVERGLGVALSKQAGFTASPSLGARPFDAGGRAALVGAAAQFDGSGALPDACGLTSAGHAVDYPTSADAPGLVIADGARADVDAVPPRMQFLAQLRRTFLLCEAEDALIILDQHAAAERVTFDRLRRAFAARAIAQQVLLVPELFDAATDEVELAESLRDECVALGVDLRPMGAQRLGVFAVPQIVATRDPRLIARDLLVELSRESGRAFSNRVDLALATMACHGSLRAGDLVTPDVARELLASLAEVDFAGHCPHGRPILSRIPMRDLLLRVGRSGDVRR